MAEAAFDASETFEAFQPGRRFAGDDKLYVKFFLHAVEDQQRSLEAGRPVFVEREYIEMAVPGDKDNIICRPVREMDRRRFGSRYKSFKDGLTETLVGTPLVAWPGLTKAQVEELKYFNVQTVEQLADLSDETATRYAGFLGLKQKAKVYLERAAGGAVDARLQAEVAKKDNEIAALQRQMAEMAAAIQKLSDPETKKGK